MKKEYKEAFRSYLNIEENIESNILNYFKERLEQNKETLEELIKLNTETRKEYKAENETFLMFNMNEKEITYEEICSIIDEESKRIGGYKYSNNMIINEEKFVLARIDMPIGTIAVITGDVREKIRYMLNAVISHNVIDIIDPYYNEHDVFQFLIGLLKTVTEKFNVDSRITNYLPIEEYSEKRYQKILNLCDEKYNKLEEIEEKDVVEKKELLIYVQDEDFKSEVEDEQGIDIIYEEDYEKAIEKINKNRYKAVSVYTKNPEIAYLALNEIYSENIFVNTNIRNNEIVEQIFRKQDSIEEIKHIKIKARPNVNEIPIYITKNVIYKMNDELADNIRIIESNEDKKETTALVKTEDSNIVMKKIKAMLKKIFGFRSNK